jgi:hypothetical protein
MELLTSDLPNPLSFVGDSAGDSGVNPSASA